MGRAAAETAFTAQHAPAARIFPMSILYNHVLCLFCTY